MNSWCFLRSGILWSGNTIKFLFLKPDPGKSRHKKWGFLKSRLQREKSQNPETTKPQTSTETPRHIYFLLRRYETFVTPMGNFADFADVEYIHSSRVICLYEDELNTIKSTLVSANRLIWSDLGALSLGVWFRPGKFWWRYLALVCFAVACFEMLWVAWVAC